MPAVPTRSTSVRFAATLALCGLALGLVIGASAALLTVVRLPSGQGCGYTVELALNGARYGGGEVPESVYREETVGCDRAAAGVVTTAEVLFWSAFAAVLLAVVAVILLNTVGRRR